MTVGETNMNEAGASGGGRNGVARQASGLLTVTLAINQGAGGQRAGIYPDELCAGGEALLPRRDARLCGG